MLILPYKTELEIKEYKLNTHIRAHILLPIFSQLEAHALAHAA